MKTIIKTNLLIILILSLVFGCSKAPVPTKPVEKPTPNPNENGTGLLKILTVNNSGQKIDSAEVYLNGDSMGFSPIIINSIPYGIHTLRLQKSGFEIHSEDISIENELQITKEIRLKNLPLNTGQLFLTVNQDSTKITVTNDKNEIVDEDINKELTVALKAGGYFVNCEKSGYKIVFKAVKVGIDSVTVENINLEKIDNSSLPQIALIVPESGQVNQPVLISWEAINANHVDIDYIENPGLNGKREVIFKSPGAHIVRAFAYNTDGQASVADTIIINQVSTEQPTIELTTAKETVYVNDVVTLSWESKNATTVNVDFVPSAGLKGQWQHIFQEAGQYSVNAYAYGPGGQAHDEITITVIEKNTEPPVINLTVSPKEVALNQPVFINWTSQNANSVDVDFVPAAGLEGQWQTVFSTPGTVIIKAHAYGEGGHAVDADTIVVNNEIAKTPQIELSVSPKQAFIDEQVTITWQSQDAEDVDVDFVPNAGLEGQWQFSFNKPGQYVINGYAYNKGIKVEASDTVTIIEPEAPELEFSVTPKELSFGEPVFVSWETNGYQVIIDQGIGVRGSEGSEEITFENPGTKIFKAIAYGQDNIQTMKIDSVVILEPEEPELPVLALAVSKEVEIGTAAVIEWQSWNANNVDVDYIQNTGLSGKREITFLTLGQKIITATAYNEAGQVTVKDTLTVVDKPVEVNVETILVPSGATVCAVHNKCQPVIDDAGTVTIETEGYYRITAAMFYNSGEDQKNESCYITIDNLTPNDPNAGQYKVIADDPGTPHVAERNAGLFFLTKGQHTFQLHHYVTIADEYPQFVVDGPINGPESIEVLFFKVEFVN